MKALLQSPLWSQSIGLSVARIVGALAGLASQIILARFLGADELGTFYFASSAALIIGSIAALGYSGTANRLVVRYRLRRDISSLEGFVATAWKDAGLMATLCLGPIIAVIMLSGHASSSLALAIAAAAGVPAFALLRVNGGLANALRHHGLSFLPDNLLRPVLLAGVVAAIWFGGYQADVSGLLAVSSGLAIMLAVGQMVLLRRALAGADDRFSVRHALGSRPDRRQVSLWRGSGRLLVTQLLINGMFADVMILLAGFMLASAQLGIFGLAVKIAFLLGFIIQATHQIVMPAIAEHLALREKHSAKQLIDRANVMAIAVTGGGLAALFLFGQQLLGLFGAEFQSGFWVLIILAVSQLARAAAGPALSLLIAGGKQDSSLGPHILAPFLFALALAALGPSHGSIGAALAALITVVTTGVWMAWLASREMFIRCDAMTMFARPSHLLSPTITRETNA